MSQQPAREPLVGEVRFRVPLPLVIPVIALAVIAAFTIGLSRVLLSLEAEAAVVVATATAANVLGASAFIAQRQNISSSSYMELMAIVLYPILIGVVIAAVGIGEEAEGAHGEAGGAPAAGAGLVIAAENIAFDTSELTLTAGEQNTLTFENNDAGIEHNVAIYASEADGLDERDPLFDGQIFPGVGTEEYNIPALDEGEYYFQCDVHKNMNGTATAE